MTIIDIGCWERGCACYDSRIPAETVEVVRRDWVSLTDEEIHEIYEQAARQEPYGGIWTRKNVVQAIEAKLKELNT